jgi:hypothetical protein
VHGQDVGQPIQLWPHAKIEVELPVWRIISNVVSVRFNKGNTFFQCKPIGSQDLPKGNSVKSYVGGAKGVFASLTGIVDDSLKYIQVMFGVVDLFHKWIKSRVW